MDEQQLLKDCLKGDVHAQKRLYEKYARKMFGVCLRYAGDQPMAEDFMQEGFIRVFANLKNYRMEGSFEGWIRRIMINTSLEILRKKDIFRYASPLDNDFQVSDQAEEGEDVPDTDALVRLIQAMPAGFRAVFNLYVVENCSHKEIGQMLGISEGTSKSQYARARAWLQKRLKG
ncbi:sigma-70 family RNA polymerase sigma factor [Lentimicrobium sp.]|jgi:RNA polymerase sigma-70 factor (ECF subfamily)|uniref:RNA polymerase sigma factor n=1 Tax=Lentimicrobium sp. TaxID=2034841 RepID=UPI0025D2DFAA|nr:sigma-70 family RNA polymerase sigma factor [Lentimicrobium sp.]MCO5255225.1 sigma-70 family RNA polymerase sigma factor [Lentimicrobium sp.]HOP14166.1 sigma-70 family RNA polymerase sigma factor [Lentimicrobium sp.]HPF63415.1 sigma-70 family RNA polymerase sigma factor [Lentimicrobium sp.]HPJ62451.1 sigma-70 family RNA polymerase sigma factor [Lentimicrobium sp.]HPR25717.1 sigma-70 family RNA polymerase sigma factor [Lentimicrobium sp.]